MNVSATIAGLPEIRAAVKRLEEGTVIFGRLYGVIGTNVRYAPYQEYGTRFMPGRFFLTRARDALLPTIGPTMAPAVMQGADAVRKAFQTLLFRGLATAQRGAPVRTGQLRGSLMTRLETR